MSYGTIRLETGQDWEIDGNVVTVREEGGAVTVWRPPRGRPKVSLRPAGKGRSRLVVGGYASIAVEVVGPTGPLKKLMGEL